MIKAFHFNKFLFFLKFILIFNMFSIMINNTYTFYMNSPMFVPSYPFDKISRRLLGHLRHRKPFSLYFLFFYDLLFLINGRRAYKAWQYCTSFDIENIILSILTMQIVSSINSKYYFGKIRFKMVF